MCPRWWWCRIYMLHRIVVCVVSLPQTPDQSPLKTICALDSMHSIDRLSICPLPSIWYPTELLGHLPSVLGTLLWFLVSKISFALEEWVSGPGSLNTLQSYSCETLTEIRPVNCRQAEPWINIYLPEMLWVVRVPCLPWWPSQHPAQIEDRFALCGQGPGAQKMRLFISLVIPRNSAPWMRHWHILKGAV